jgi:hypothetical protein
VPARQVVRAHGIALQPGQDLCARAFHRVRIEPRLGQRQPQIVEGLVAIVLEGPQSAAQKVTPRPEVELDGLALEPVLEGRGIVRPGALVEQAGRHVGHARLVGGILVGAAGEGKLHGDQRQSAVAHQPGFDAAGAHHPFDRHRPRRRRGKGNYGAGDQRDESARSRAADRSGRVHERFSSGRVSLIR